VVDLQPYICTACVAANPVDINNSDQAAGVITDYSYRGRAFIWDPNAPLVDLGPSLGEANNAISINDREQVVGNYFDGAWHAFMWEPETGLHDIGLNIFVDAVNGEGQVVGARDLDGGATGRRAFLLQVGSSVRDLGVLPGDSSSRARSINDEGIVVGESQSPRGTRAFVWHEGTGMQELPSLPGSATTRAFGINADGQIVGDSGGHAVLWTHGSTTPTVAQNDSYQTLQDTSLYLDAPGVLANDADNLLQAVLETSTSHGALSLSSDGSFTYTPSVGFTGIDNFTYKATSASYASNVASVTIRTLPNGGGGGDSGGNGGPPNPGATPELDSLTLVGTGLSALLAYAVNRRRACKN
jgi:probable HAF family extracellular repeat protein